MKKVDLIITLTLAILLLASMVDAQRTSRITRPCPSTATPARVSVEVGGDVAIVPCSSGETKIFDASWTDTHVPGSSLLTVGSQTAVSVPADDHFFATRTSVQATAVNTASKFFGSQKNALTLNGTPTGAVFAAGFHNTVSSSSTWNPSNSGNLLYGIYNTLDMGAQGGAAEYIGVRSSAHIGSVNVGAVTLQAAIRGLSHFGYAATVTNAIGVDAYVYAVTNNGGSATNAKILRASRGQINVPLTNLYGLYVGEYAGTAGSITNNYGVYIDDTTDDHGTNKWAFYSASTANSFLSGKLSFDATYTAGGTTGNQTINKPAFSVNFAAAASSLTVTNSFVAATSVLLCTVQTNDSTLKSVSAVAGSGSVVLHANAAATAETKVYCEVKN